MAKLLDNMSITVQIRNFTLFLNDFMAVALTSGPLTCSVFFSMTNDLHVCRMCWCFSSSYLLPPARFLSAPLLPN